MPQPFNQRFRFVKTFIILTVIVAITLILFLAFLPNPPTTPDPTKQLVAVNLATSYLQRLQAEQSITEPTYFEYRLTINDQLYKIEVMATTTEHPNTLSITVNVFSADHQVEGVAEGYVEISHAQNET